MDNEALVDQIVRSLSFEVVAAPQNVVPVDSSSKTTPLNVKIKVRKKQGAGLRHGVISMPQVDTRAENRKHEPRERIRLVSSDQSIMNFDVLMEAEFDKGILSNQNKQNLNMIAPETDKELNPSPIFVKKNKDIFGKCKPGGCLDPPFGEDKYSYQPTKQNLSQPLKDESAKLRSSSIFKNNIFKKKRKSSQDDVQLDKTDAGSKCDTDSNMGLHETGSLTQHSNPLITYPHPLDRKIAQKQDERKLSKDDERSNRMRTSSDEKSRSSSIDEGSYFIIPKKIKRRSNQSDTQESLKPDTKQDAAIITFLKSEFTDDVKSPETNPTPGKGTTFIPVPVVVPLPSLFNKKEDKSDINKDHDTLTQNATVSEPFVESSSSSKLQKDIESDEQHKSDFLIKNQTDKISEPIQNGSSSQTIIQNDDPIKNLKEGAQAVFLKSSFHEPENIATVGENESDANNLKALGGDSSTSAQIDPKSHPLLAEAREKSIIGITDSSNKVLEDKNTLKEPEQQKRGYSSANLKEIWENENDPLKSTADVIFKANIPLPHDDALNRKDSLISTKSNQSLIHETVSENVQPEDHFIPKENEQTLMSDSEARLKTSKIPSPSNFTTDELYNSKTELQNNLNNEIKQETSNDLENTVKEYNDVPYETNENTLQPTKSIINEKKYGLTKTPLKDPLETSFVEDYDTITIEHLMDLKKVRSVSDLSIIGSIQEERKLDINIDIPKYSTDFNETLETPEQPTTMENSSHISFKIDEVPMTKYSEGLKKTTDNLQAMQPTSILKKAFWKMDIALQSYIDENNEKIIKSFDSKQSPQRQPNDSVLVAQCYLGSDVNEIKIPVDFENDLNVKIAQNALPQNQPMTNLRQELEDTSKDDPPKKKNIKINIPASDTDISDQHPVKKDAKISEPGISNTDTINEDVRNTLNRIYEDELLPLQDIIKDLRGEIDALVSYQTKYKEIVSRTAPKRPRTARIVQPNKRCACIKKL